MSLTFTEDAIPDYFAGGDSVPDTNEVEYPCQVCGREAGPYRGKGRKPTKCDDHKVNRTASSPRGANDKLAEMAADALCQVNGLMALGAMVIGFTDTGVALQGTEEDFRLRAIAALKTDAKLCQQIIKGGTSSAKVALVIGYAFVGVTVFPTALNEYQEKKAVRDKAARELAATEVE